MVATEQLTVDREIPLSRQTTEERAASERAARESLRAQVAKLEGELSRIVARGFPHITPAPFVAPGRPGPRLLSLAELERERDRLVACLRRAQSQACERAELELRSRDLLERMQLEPGRYRFVRLRVADLGERGCGVWQVRPRLGLIGMLAGWWQVKLSSGCPLPGPRASLRAASLDTRQRGSTRRRSLRASVPRCGAGTVPGRRITARPRSTAERLIAAHTRAARPLGPAGAKAPRRRSLHRLRAGIAPCSRHTVASVCL